MDPVKFGKYIRELRKEKKLTIRQLELYSGVSNAYLSHIENGKRGIPSPEILKKIHKALGVSYEELMEKAGYLDFATGDFWEELVIFIGKYSTIPKYREVLMAYFELLELYYHRKYIVESYLTSLENEFKKIGLSLNKQLFRTNPPKAFEEARTRLQEVMDADDDFEVAESAMREQRRMLEHDPRIKFFRELEEELGVDFADPDKMEALKKAAKILFISKS